MTDGFEHTSMAEGEMFSKACDATVSENEATFEKICRCLRRVSLDSCLGRASSEVLEKPKKNLLQENNGAAYQPPHRLLPTLPEAQKVFARLQASHQLQHLLETHLFLPFGAAVKRAVYRLESDSWSKGERLIHSRLRDREEAGPLYVITKGLHRLGKRRLEVQGALRQWSDEIHRAEKTDGGGLNNFDQMEHPIFQETPLRLSEALAKLNLVMMEVVRESKHKVAELQDKKGDINYGLSLTGLLGPDVAIQFRKHLGGLLGDYKPLLRILSEALPVVAAAAGMPKLGVGNVVENLLDDDVINQDSATTLNPRLRRLTKSSRKPVGLQTPVLAIPASAFPAPAFAPPAFQPSFAPPEILIPPPPGPPGRNENPASVVPYSEKLADLVLYLSLHLNTPALQVPGSNGSPVNVFLISDSLVAYALCLAIRHAAQELKSSSSGHGNNNKLLLGLDLEGVQLGQSTGLTSLLQMHVTSLRRVDSVNHHHSSPVLRLLLESAFILDLRGSREEAKEFFSYAQVDRLLQDADVTKILFDFRADVSALWRQFDLDLGTGDRPDLVDLQILRVTRDLQQKRKKSSFNMFFSMPSFAKVLGDHLDKKIRALVRVSGSEDALWHVKRIKDYVIQVKKAGSAKMREDAGFWGDPNRELDLVYAATDVVWNGDLYRSWQEEGLKEGNDFPKTNRSSTSAEEERTSSCSFEIESEDGGNNQIEMDSTSPEEKEEKDPNKVVPSPRSEAQRWLDPTPPESPHHSRTASEAPSSGSSSCFSQKQKNDDYSWNGAFSVRAHKMRLEDTMAWARDDAVSDDPMPWDRWLTGSLPKKLLPYQNSSFVVW